MNIGFDLDNVFISTPPFIPDSIIDRLYRKHSSKKLSYRFPSPFEQRIRILSHLYIFRPAIKKNIAICRKKKRKNDSYMLISSRYKFLKSLTESIIRRYQLDDLFDTMIFNFENKQPHLFKESVMATLKIDRYVDDDIHLLNFVAAKNENIQFFWLNTHEDKKLADNLWAITDIATVFKKKL